MTETELRELFDRIMKTLDKLISDVNELKKCQITHHHYHYGYQVPDHYHYGYQVPEIQYIPIVPLTAPPNTPTIYPYITCFNAQSPV